MCIDRGSSEIHTMMLKRNYGHFLKYISQSAFFVSQGIPSFLWHSIKAFTSGLPKTIIAMETGILGHHVATRKS